MKKQHIIRALLFTFISFALSSQDLPRLEPVALYSRLANVSGELTEEQFIEAAVIASGSENERTDRLRFRELIKDIVSSVPLSGGEYQRGEEILKSLHDGLFLRYDEDQTRIDNVLDTGTYNCVSSAVIYMAVGRAAGLDIRGVRTTDHAFISLRIESEIVDVETTNLWGFDPGQKKEFTDSFSGSTGYNYVPPGNYRLRQDITDRQMIGLILQNRIAGLQRRNNHRESVPLAIDRYALTGSPEAQKDMYDTFSNYSSLLNGSGQYEKGITFLRSAMDRWGRSEKVIQALEALLHNHLLSMIEQGRSSEAEVYLSEIAAEAYVRESAIESDRAMIYDRRTVDLLNSNENFDVVQSYLNKVYEEGFLSDSKWIDYTLYNYVKEAEIIANSSGWLDAYLFVKAAPLDIQSKSKYRQLLNSCKGNYVVTVHNRFADLYNSGQYEDAEAVVLRGLAIIPDDSTLKSDLQMIQRKKTP